jgi:hypothetical protein
MAAGNTYESIATQTLGSAAASVTFSSIPGTYTDLVLIFNGKGAASGNVTFQFNGDTGTNYSATIIYGDGSSAGSVRVSSQSSMNIGSVGTDWTTNTFSIMNYANATTYKTVLGRYSRPDEVGAKVGLWRSTSAITSIVVGKSSGTYDTGSTFSLYGIKAA